MVYFMIPRLLQLPRDQNLFLFGARSTGKSTLIEGIFDHENSLWIDLLDPLQEERFLSNPSELKALVLGLSPSTTHVVIDEVQKIPKLLDVIHALSNKVAQRFIMTGSSARKLKHGGANLLAGRAFMYHLFPFSFLELKENFDLSTALEWGALPAITDFDNDEHRLQFLLAYAHTYLKEEIWAEQFIRKLDPFRKFLEVAAQSNGKIVNVANIARDVRVDDKTIRQYFSILEDTLLGFFLEPYQTSIRKRLSQKPKFYFFDCGVVRALNRSLTIPLRPGTSAYGEAFEHLIILESFKLCSYFKPEYRLTYLRTKEEKEIDLIVERPGEKLLLIEIKSSSDIQEKDLKNFLALSRELPNSQAICLSNDLRRKQFEHVRCLHWQEGLSSFFTNSTPPPE